MKIIFTFAELEALQNTAVGLNDQLMAVVPGLKNQVGKSKKSILNALLDAELKTPQLVTVDMLNATVVITVPEELVTESIAVVGSFYEELVEMVPLVMVIAKMAKKAIKRYEANVNTLGEKFKKLVKASD